MPLIECSFSVKVFYLAQALDETATRAAESFMHDFEQSGKSEERDDDGARLSGSFAG